MRLGRTLPAVALAASVGLLVWSLAGGRPAAPPALVAPDVIDFGPQPSGAVVEREFDLANPGGGLLRLTGFRSSCTCSGLEVREGGDWVAAGSLVVSPAVSPTAECG